MARDKTCLCRGEAHPCLEALERDTAVSNNNMAVWCRQKLFVDITCPCVKIRSCRKITRPCGYVTCITEGYEREACLRSGPRFDRHYSGCKGAYE